MPQAAALVVVAIAAAASTYASVKQRQAAKRAANAQEEAADTASAQQKNQEMEARRQQIRQQRIRTAQVQQAASSAGVSQSSGELGSLSALSTNVSSNLANISGQALAAQGIGNANQRVMNSQGDIQQWGNFGQIASSVGSIAGAYSQTSMAQNWGTQSPAPITQAQGTPTGHN